MGGCRVWSVWCCLCGCENFLEEEGRQRLAPSSTEIVVVSLAQRVDICVCFGFYVLVTFIFKLDNFRMRVWHWGRDFSPNLVVKSLKVCMQKGVFMNLRSFLPYKPSETLVSIQFSSLLCSFFSRSHSQHSRMRGSYSI